MTNNQEKIIAKAKNLGMFTSEEVVVLVSKILHDARQFNPNYFELNFREKAEFEHKWISENITH